MLLTENEAKKARCPFVQPVPIAEPMGGARLQGLNCGASTCMAWRFTGHKRTENREERPRGFCGNIRADHTTSDVAFDPTPQEPKTMLLGK